MMMVLDLDIKKYVKNAKKVLKQRIESLPQKPQLAIIQVGNNPASERYIRNKRNDCDEVGIIAHHYWFEEDITTEELLFEINTIQEFYNGVIVQQPLPPQIDQDVIDSAIDPERDVDGFNPVSHFNPATPKGIMDYLEHCKFNLNGANVVIIGRSNIVGKPLAKMMIDANATVTLCHSHTPRKKLYAHILRADLVVTATGQPQWLSANLMTMPVIDVGISFNAEGKLVGDCYNTQGKMVTPVPGGVGLMTRLALLENVVKATEVQNAN